jgi:hypothetical protein
VAVYSFVHDMSKPRDEVHCPMESSCPMYGLFQLAGMQGMWEALYCHANFERCARYQTSCKGHPVPRAMLPDGSLLRPTKHSINPRKR